VLFGPVTNAINAKIAKSSHDIILVNYMLGCSSSRQAVSAA